MSEKRYVSFCIDGKWFTDYLRNSFLYENQSYEWVIEVLGECIKGPNGLDNNRITQMAQDIILGRSRFTGNSGDGSFKYLDGSDEPIKPDFFRRYANMSKELKSEREARIDADEAWQELALVVKGEIKRDDCESKRNVELLKPTPAEEYIERMISDDEDTPPYGFITPDGTFHEVQWADHERFAGDYIRAHDGWESILEHGVHTGTDYLVLVKGWLLLHNPRQGKPILTSGDKPMTKAQREALFDYYTNYGMEKEANALYLEERS